MILEIQQTYANEINQFKILEQNRILYNAATPFINPATPIGSNSLHQLSLTDPAGHVAFTTRYNVLENFKESAIPLSYLFKDSKKISKYSILDSSNNICGAFYLEYNALMSHKMCMEYHEQLITCFKRSVGDREVVSFYQAETQIGQLTKPNCVAKNLDHYFIHFIDGYQSWIPIISLFVIYYDFLYHNHSGEYMSKGYDNNKTYTYDKNNNKYNKDFIRNNFGESEYQRINTFIKQSYSNVHANSGFDIKKFWIIFAGGWAITILACLIILLIILL